MKKKIISLGAVILIATAVSAYAGTAYEDYSTTVPALNHSGYTGSQTKVTTGSAADLHSHSVGGSYVVDVRQNGATNGDWTRNVTDNNQYWVDGDAGQKINNDVKLEFSNDWNTPVSVQVEGVWASN